MNVFGRKKLKHEILMWRLPCVHHINRLGVYWPLILRLISRCKYIFDFRGFITIKFVLHISGQSVFSRLGFIIGILSHRFFLGILWNHWWLYRNTKYICHLFRGKFTGFVLLLNVRITSSLATLWIKNK